MLEGPTHRCNGTPGVVHYICRVVAPRSASAWTKVRFQRDATTMLLTQ